MKLYNFCSISYIQKPTVFGWIMEFDAESFSHAINVHMEGARNGFRYCLVMSLHDQLMINFFHVYLYTSHFNSYCWICLVPTIPNLRDGRMTLLTYRDTLLNTKHRQMITPSEFHTLSAQGKVCPGEPDRRGEKVHAGGRGGCYCPSGLLLPLLPIPGAIFFSLGLIRCIDCHGLYGWCIPKRFIQVLYRYNQIRWII